MDFRRTENKEAKRVWFITDTHLGVRNNSNEWLDQMREYFFDWFFPLVEKHYQTGDILVHLGDYFDSRQSINLKVLDLGVEIAEKASSVFKDGVYIILGNHDVWGKSSNDVNSLKSLKWIPRINIYEEPQSTIFGTRKFFLMPWRPDHASEKNTLESIEHHDVLCCHSDVKGLKFNKYTTVEDGPELSSFLKFDRVYSGHIHYSQKNGNVKMLGSPYELTRSDMDNPKSITLLDLDTMEEQVFSNDFSPKFKRFYFSELLEMTPEQLEPLFRNNFVDIMIDPVMAIKAPLSILTDTVTTQRTLKFHPFDANQVTNLSQQILDSEGRQFNVVDFISDYVESQNYDDETKKKLISSLKKIHSFVVSQDHIKNLS